MPEATSWNVISNAGLGQVILAVDFPAVGRVEAGFTELAEKAGSQWAEYDVLHTEAPDGPIDPKVVVQDYVSRWAEEARADGRQVAVVLGYCAGAVYAAAIAEEVSRWQESAPTVVLFDPQAGAEALAAEMCREMYRMVDMLASQLTAEQVADAKKKAAELAASGVSELFELGIALTGLFRETATAAFDKLGLSEAGREETVALFQGYMYWLAMTTQVDPSATWKISTAILSAEFAAEAAEAGQDTASYGQTIVVEPSHADLLRSEVTVEQVLEQLKS